MGNHVALCCPPTRSKHLALLALTQGQTQPPPALRNRERTAPATGPGSRTQGMPVGSEICSAAHQPPQVQGKLEAAAPLHLDLPAPLPTSAPPAPPGTSLAAPSQGKSSSLPVLGCFLWLIWAPQVPSMGGCPVHIPQPSPSLWDSPKCRGGSGAVCALEGSWRLMQGRGFSPVHS